MRVDGLARRASSKRKAEESEPPPEPAAKKKKIVKVHARNSTGSLKRAQSLSEQASQQSSPAPFSRTHKTSPLPIKSEDAPDEGQSLRSIAESGVLAASLARSRSKWLSEGIFERYWVKSSGYRKKGAPEIPANNPLPSTMQKLGACQMIAEPHVFDVVLYTIKDPIVVQTPLPAKVPIYGGTNSPNAATSRPHLAPSSQQSYGNTLGAKMNLAPSSGAVQPAWSPASQPRVQTQPALPVPRLPHPNPTSQPNPTNTSAQKSPAAPSPPSTTQPAQAAGNRQTTASQPTAATTTTPPVAKPAQDPVIQMLAQRASINPELKVLMKIVASGGASKSQLAVFQGHIDDLTNILNRQNQSQNQNQNQNQSKRQTQTQTQGQSQTDEKSSEPQAPPSQSIPSQQQPRANPSLLKANQDPAADQPQAQPARPPQQQQSYQHSLSQPTHSPSHFQSSPLAYPHQQQPSHLPPHRPSLKTSLAPHPRPLPPIRGIALEFTSPEANGDRYTFPLNSLLSYQPYGRLVTASFLVVRKGDDSRPDFLAKQSYHQPVTVTFCCANSRTLEPLARVVNAPEAVREHMREVMNSTKRAPGTTLALQLPSQDEQSKNNNDSAATPTELHAADRRSSLKLQNQTQIMRGSPVARTGPSTSSLFSSTNATSKKKTAEEPTCRYCFDYMTVPDAAPFVAAGEAPACKSCSALRAKEAAGRGAAVVGAGERGLVMKGAGGLPGTETAKSMGMKTATSRGGPKVLMFARQGLGHVGVCG